ncbi:daxx-like protein isoform X3 [Toxorhynchites rutilus septentrionalis]|uniref:daxx-like protein isoform X3 n=1 Tax=Toxorhynchites rutilus septentrionalis TaxID=329112 RepID=UPI0024790330|nr:daxx-like protein isoform X3 [Toxorhynchites rutilus septentrionalis]
MTRGVMFYYFGEPKRRKLAPPGPMEFNGKIPKVGPPAEPKKIKRIKPITVATDLRKEAENNNRPAVNDNFAIISYSDEWEKDLQKYQQIVQQHEENNHQQQQQQQMVAKKKSPLTSVLEEDASDRKTATPGSSSTADSHSTSRSEKKEKKGNVEKNSIGKEFAELLEACKKADSSPEMQLLIQKKLIKYYECVHPDYINSKSFKKTLAAVTADVLAHPELVYLKLASIVEELNIRRKSRNSVMTNEDVTSTGSEKKDNQIRRLNRALYILKKRIAKLEEMEVDFDEDINSAYLMEERYKKRAFEIYEKICDITGESKHAHRIVRKPIHFDGSHYPEFNRTIQMFVNRTSTFPDYFDVLKCLQHCNSQYGYQLRRDEMTKIAQDAFIKIGKLLQKRRKTDLYESVSYYTGAEKDPALVDRKLLEKLEDNKKHYGKIDNLIDKFARAQDNNTDDEGDAVTVGASSQNTKPSSSGATKANEDPSASSKDKSSSQSKQVDPAAGSSSNSSGSNVADERGTSNASNSGKTEDVKQEEEKSPKETSEEAEEDYEDDEDEDDDEEDEMLIKENVKPDTFDDIEISDDEELLVSTS